MRVKGAPPSTAGHHPRPRVTLSCTALAGRNPRTLACGLPGTPQGPSPHASHQPGYGSRVGRERRDSGTVRKWMWGRQAGGSAKSLAGASASCQHFCWEALGASAPSLEVFRATRCGDRQFCLWSPRQGRWRTGHPSEKLCTTRWEGKGYFSRHQTGKQQAV